MDEQGTRIAPKASEAVALQNDCHALQVAIFTPALVCLCHIINSRWKQLCQDSIS